MPWAKKKRQARPGSHRKGHDPVTGALSSVPYSGSKDLKLGTLRAIVPQLGLDWEAFQNT